MAASPSEIVLFDFISHETMHLPFNEEYLRVVRAAFPQDAIVFRARAGHIANLAPRVADLTGVTFDPCEPWTQGPITRRWGDFFALERAS